MLKISWRGLSEGEIQEAQTLEYQLTSNGCALATEKEMKQRFNYMTAKLIKCNIDNEYGPSSAVESTPNCERTEKDKRKVKKRKKTAFILNQIITICQNQQFLQKKLNILKKQISLCSDIMTVTSASVIYKILILMPKVPDAP